MKYRIRATASVMMLSFLLCTFNVNAETRAGVCSVDYFGASVEDPCRVAGISASLFSLLDQSEKSTIQPRDISMIKLPNGGYDTVTINDSIQSVGSDFESYDCYCAVDVLNIRLAPSKDSVEVGEYLFGNKLTIVAEIDGWGLTDKGWVCLDYTSETVGNRIVYCPKTSGRKSFEYYTALRAYRQADLQEIAFTDSEGFRKVNGRYCIAVGTGVSSSVGTYVDIVLVNGTTINCIIGDIKADKDTMRNNIVTAHNRCASEFIVSHDLRSDLRRDGNVSKRVSEWDSPVDYFIVYEYNVFD